MEQNVTGHGSAISGSQRRGEWASLASVSMTPPSVAREELCLVVRAQDGSHDSQSLFPLLTDSTSWPQANLTFVGLTHSILSHSACLPENSEVCIFILKLCAKLISEERLALGLMEVAASGFRNECKKSLFIYVCYFLPFLHLSLKASWRLLSCCCCCFV